MSLNLCRLCCKNDQNAIDVLDDPDKKLCHKINKCFGVQIKKEDPITKKICKCCYYFTNSVYEHRIVSQENDIKLKEEYKQLTALKPEISQSDFLNSLKLDSIKIHKSISSLKRKYPTIIIPECLNDLDLDPFVKIQNRKKRKDESWSISSKASSGTGLVFTMVKQDEPVAEKKSTTPTPTTTTTTRKIRRFSCETCHKVFIEEKPFLSHKCNIREYYQCVTCNKGFKYKESLEHHRSFYHKTQTVITKIPDVSETADLRTLLDMNEKINESIKQQKNIENIQPGRKVQLESLKNVRKVQDNRVEGPKNVRKTQDNRVEGPKKTEKNKEAENKDKEVIREVEEILFESPKSVPNLLESPKNVSNILESPKNPRNDLLIQDAEVHTFLCLTCNKIFDTPDSLTYHKRYAHKSSLRCDFCPKKFQVVETLMKHQETHRKKRFKDHQDKEKEKEKEVEKENEVEKEKETQKEDLLIMEEVPPPELLNSEKVFVQEFKESVSPSIVKRTVPTLSVSLEPLVLKPLSDNSSPTVLKPLPTTTTKSPPGKMVARKRTNGADFVSNPEETYRISSDSDSSLLSSSDEDDCKITEVFTDPLTESKKSDEPKNEEVLITENEVFLETENEECLDMALEPQNDPIEMDESDLVVEISTSATTVIKSDTTVTETEKTQKDDDDEMLKKFDEVFLIDDSDSEIEFTDKVEPTTKADSTTTKADSTTKTAPNSTDSTKVTSPILIQATDDVPTDDTTIANEINFINYLINKFTCDDKTTTVPQNWNLHFLKMLAKKRSIPIEIKKSNDPKIVLTYLNTIKPKTKAPISSSPWNHSKAIDLNIGVNNKAQKQQKPINQLIIKNHKASIKVPIPQTPQTVKAKIINGPRTNQFTTKYIPVTSQITPPLSLTPPSSQIQQQQQQQQQKEIATNQSPQFYNNQHPLFKKIPGAAPTSSAQIHTFKEILPKAPQINGPKTQQFQFSNTFTTSKIQQREILPQPPQFHNKEIVTQPPPINGPKTQQFQFANTSKIHQKEILPQPPQYHIKEILQKPPINKTQQFQTYIPPISATTSKIQQKDVSQPPQFYVSNQNQDQHQRSILKNQLQPNHQLQLNNQQQQNQLQVNHQQQQQNQLQSNQLQPNQQQLLYTYVPTSQQVFNQQKADQSFMITNINKNATIVFQQIDQPNFINISQPENVYMQPNIIQQQQQQQKEQHHQQQHNQQHHQQQHNQQHHQQQHNQQHHQQQHHQQQLQQQQHHQQEEPDLQILEETLEDDEHRPLIRIKNLSELTNKSPSPESYLNVYTNYVKAKEISGAISYPMTHNLL